MANEEDDKKVQEQQELLSIRMGQVTEQHDQKAQYGMDAEEAAEKAAEKDSESS